MHWRICQMDYSVLLVELRFIILRLRVNWDHLTKTSNSPKWFRVLSTSSSQTSLLVTSPTSWSTFNMYQNDFNIFLFSKRVTVNFTLFCYGKFSIIVVNSNFILTTRNPKLDLILTLWLDLLISETDTVYLKTIIYINLPLLLSVRPHNIF